MASTPRGAKRRRSRTPLAGSSPTPAGHPTHGRRDSESSLPPSSPPPPFSDTDDSFDERDAVREIDDEDQEGEDLFGEDLEEDYAPNQMLDTYSDAGINDENFDEMSAAARRAAEAKMDRRDAQGGRRGARAARRSRMPDFLQSDDLDDDFDAGLLAGTKRRTRRQYDERKELDDMEGIEDELPLEQLSDIKTKSIAEWIANERVRRSIVRHFRQFLMTYVDEHGASVYGQRIRNLGENNSESLEVSYLRLALSKPILAYFLTNSPTAMLAIFDEVALNAILVGPRPITDLPLSSSLRDLRLSGVLKYVKFDCRKCGAVLGPFYQDATKEVKIRQGPFSVNSEQTVYRNYQKMTLQESPGSVPPGRLPRHREVVLLWDLIDTAKPGRKLLTHDFTGITGIYRNNFDASLNSKNGFPVFSTVIEANHVNKKEDQFATPRIVAFGGVPKDINRKHRIRGDINVLLLGDPGTAKSQFLKYVEKTAHRSVFATGQGLCAKIQSRANGPSKAGPWQWSSSRSRSPRRALSLRCRRVALSSLLRIPIRGRYNPTIPFQQNVELTEPILSRFDVLCVVKDTVDPVKDELLARFVVGSHLRSHPKFEADKEEMNVGTTLDADTSCGKYIMYARERVRPKLYDLDQEKLSRLFADLRRESLATGSFPITVRHLESMIRMAEASAKMALREYVRADDIDLAISVTVGSFVSAQKMSIKKTLERGFRKYLTQARDHEELLAFLLGNIVKEKARLYQLQRYQQPELITIKISELDERAKEHDIFDTTPFLRSKLFASNGYKMNDGIIEKRFPRGDEA
ncbi:MCM2/3/5 family-domain-containing protein [Sparassis latifolia]